MRGGQLSAKVLETLAAFEAMSPQNLQIAMAPTRETLHDLAAEAASDPLFVAKPVVQIDFLGETISIPTGDASTEVNMRWEACLRNNSIGFAGCLTRHGSWAAGRARKPRSRPRNSQSARHSESTLHSWHGEQAMACCSSSSL